MWPAWLEKRVLALGGSEAGPPWARPLASYPQACERGCSALRPWEVARPQGKGLLATALLTMVVEEPKDVDRHLS